ncbi:MAG: hypothetical protein FJZ13_04270 [Candidatus Omnitrophica bacterium]|nr:hypothetical protein [Candidatus Omnitrophota bacterium]
MNKKNKLIFMAVALIVAIIILNMLIKRAEKEPLAPAAIRTQEVAPKEETCVEEPQTALAPTEEAQEEADFPVEQGPLAN